MERRTSFGRDPKLQARMVFVLFMLGLVYTALIVVLVTSGLKAIFIIVIAGGLFLVQTFGSGKFALIMMGGKVVSPEEAPELHAIVERLCIQANLPKPKVAIAQSPMPNAFALGLSPKSATVCATSGIIDMLSPAELEGVMAHELSHVASRDVMVMTLASFFASIAAFITQWGFFFGGMFGGGDDEDSDGLPFIVVFLVSIGVYIISFLLMQALSRYREFSADRGAAVLTGRPSALAAALMKISSGMHMIPKQDLRQAGASQLKAFYIFEPSAALSGGIGGLFATHPPLEKRLAALARLESQLQGVEA